MRKLIVATASLAMMVFSFFIGGGLFQLVFHSEKAPGTIIRYERKYWNKATLYPVVRFETEGKSFEFRNYMDPSGTDHEGEKVTVLFKKSDPTLAMIDYGWKNWIPWGPIFFMGLILFYASITGSPTLTAPRGFGITQVVPTIEEVHRLALTGRKVEAIKMYKRLTGSGLKESKQYVENFLNS